MIQNNILSNSPASSLSEKYKPLNTSKVLQTFLAKGWQIKSTQGGGKDGRGKHIVRLSNPFFKIGNDDLQIIVINSYDGTCSFKICLGIYRFVCANGLMIGESLFEGSKLKHIGTGFDARVEEAIRVVEVECQKVKDRIDALKNTELPSEVMDTISKTVMNLRFYGKEAPTVEDYAEKGRYRLLTRLGYKVRRDEDSDLNNAWQFLNRLQEDVIRGGSNYFHDGKGRHSFRQTKPITNIDKVVGMNRTIFDLVNKAVA